MNDPGAEPRLRSAVGRVGLAIAIAAGGWALVLVVTGGFTLQVGGLSIRSHQVARPLVVAAAALAVGLIARPGWRRRATTELGIAIERRAPALAGALTAFALAMGLAWGARDVGGSDTYGHVSEAFLFAGGRMRVEQPFTRGLPWPDADWTFAPLGYRPAPSGAAIVPTYAPGLPLVMTLAIWIAGPGAVYAVVPLLGAALIWSTFLLGRRVASGTAGVIAAVLLLLSPVFVQHHLLPMSDVPAAAWTMLALLLAERRPLLAGLAASMLVLTRPNLVLAAASIGVLSTFPRAATADASSPLPGFWGSAVGRSCLFALGLIPGCLAVAAINWSLYGSPTASGYGRLADLHAWKNAVPNLGRYWTWAVDTLTPLVLLAPGGLILAVRREGRPLAWTGVLVSAVVVAGYLFYEVFADWSYLRFMLPALPVVMVLSVAMLLAGIDLLPAAGRGAATVLVTVWLGAALVSDGRERHVFEKQPGEQRFETIGTEVGRLLPDRAVVFAEQHSGNVRFYGNRLTLRWDLLDPDWLDRSIDVLERQGRPVFFLLDDWEEAAFRVRFGSRSALGALDWPPRADWRGMHARLFDPRDRARHLAGELIPTCIRLD